MTRHESNHTCRAEFPTPLSRSLPLFLALPPAGRKRERERGTPWDRLEKPGGWEWEIISCLLWLRHYCTNHRFAFTTSKLHTISVIYRALWWQNTKTRSNNWWNHWKLAFYMLKKKHISMNIAWKILIKQRIISRLLTNGILLIISKCMWLDKCI